MGTTEISKSQLLYELDKRYSSPNTFTMCCSDTAQVNITDSIMAHLQTTPSWTTSLHGHLQLVSIDMLAHGPPWKVSTATTLHAST